jgi:hypothetical protein
MQTQQHEMLQPSYGQLTKPQPGAMCAHVPELMRLKYFYGQLLGVHDFQTEQNYFRDKLKLHNRCLHGYGTVCGLEVVPEPTEPECEPHAQRETLRLQGELTRLEQEIRQPEQSENTNAIQQLRAQLEDIRRQLEHRPQATCAEQQKPTRIQITCGVALDCDGNELIVRYPLPVDLWQELSPDDRKRVKPEGQTIYVSLCYCPLPIEPVRPVLLDSCGTTSECVYGKVKDSIRVQVTVDPPKPDDRCETCCTACADPCLLLARINSFKPGDLLVPEQIENGVRRMIGLYPFATISGISWTHGAEYTADEAKSFLEYGIKIQFSRPVLTETITRGVVDLWVIEGGRGRRADIYNMDGDYVDVPTTRTTTWLKFRQTSRETLQEGDRVLVIVRTCFILDECCRPVDGNHIGGRVPILLEYKEYDHSQTSGACAHPPLSLGPWTSGNGTPGGTFESWFYIKSTAAKGD